MGKIYVIYKIIFKSFFFFGKCSCKILKVVGGERMKK